MFTLYCSLMVFISLNNLIFQICREQFVALHSEPILEDLSKFLVKKYSYRER